MKYQQFKRYFILCFAIFSFHECISQTNSGIEMVRKNGIYVAPVSAFDSRSEIQLGFSRVFNKFLTMDIGAGVRYKSGEDPEYQPFEEEMYFGHIQRTCINEFLNSSACDEIDSPRLTTEFDNYIISNNFIQVGFKWFTNIDDKASPFYFNAGMMAGQRSYYQYESVSGSVYKNKTLVKTVDLSGDEDNWFSFGPWQRTYEMDTYSYKKLSKSKISEPYILPFVGIGLRLPFLKTFSIEGAGTLFYSKKNADLNQKRKPHVFANLQLTKWF